jgi:integrase
MSVYRPGNSPYFHYDFQWKGDRFYGSTGETEERKARQYERAEKERVKRADKRAGAAPSLDVAAGRYWDERGQYTANAAELERNIERLVRALGRDLLLADITDDLLATAIARRRAEARRGKRKYGFPSSAQVNRSFTDVLRRIMVRARDTWKVTFPAMPDWKRHRLPEPKPRVREVTVTEESRIADKEREDFRAIREFAMLTGLRLRAVVTLTWRQVDFEAGQIRVIEKGHQPRVVPITEAVRLILLGECGRHETAVFTYVAERTTRNPKSGQRTVKGERYPITYWGLTTRRRRDWKAAGVEHRWHDLRHTAAMDTMRATGNLRAVQRQLGHARITTTEIYADALIDDVAAAMEQAAEHRQNRRTKSRTIPEQSGHDSKKRKAQQ